MLGKARIFGASFIKLDGTVRSGSFRLGVIPPGKREGSERKRNLDPDEHGNLIVWDMKISAYRTIALKRVLYLRVRGKTIKPKDIQLP